MSLPSPFQYGLLFEGEMIVNFEAITDLGDEYFGVMWPIQSPLITVPLTSPIDTRILQL